MLPAGEIAHAVLDQMDVPRRVQADIPQDPLELVAAGFFGRREEQRDLGRFVQNAVHAPIIAEARIRPQAPLRKMQYYFFAFGGMQGSRLC